MIDKMGGGLRHATSATGRAKPAPFTRKSHQGVLGAGAAPEAQKTFSQDTALEKGVELVRFASEQQTLSATRPSARGGRSPEMTAKSRSAMIASWPEYCAWVAGRDAQRQNHVQILTGAASIVGNERLEKDNGKDLRRVPELELARGNGAGGTRWYPVTGQKVVADAISLAS